jgi:hypothetical protein
LLALLLLAGSGRAHRLVAEYRVLPGRLLEVWARYKVIPRSIPAVDAQVRIFRPGGQTLAEGRTDENGRFTCRYERREWLRVEVYQEGHRAEVPIDQSELPAASESVPRAVAAEKTAPKKPPEEAGREWVKDVVIGISFLLSLAAFVLCLRNARTLRKLQKRDGQPPA